MKLLAATIIIALIAVAVCFPALPEEKAIHPVKLAKGVESGDLEGSESAYLYYPYAYPHYYYGYHYPYYLYGR